MFTLIFCLFNIDNRLLSESVRNWDTKWHNINNVEFAITNYGKLGIPCYWPRGSGHNYIFGSGLWLGAIDSVIGDTVVSVGYGPHGGETEFVPGLYEQNPGAPYVIIYMYPDPWPAPVDTFPMAPQQPKSDQDSWCCYNECDSNYHMPGDTRPIGVEVYQTVYAWARSHLMDIVFLNFEVKNVLHRPIRNLYIGYCADCDIGNEAGPYANDIVSAIVGRWYVVEGESLWVDNLAYQWQETNEPGWNSTGAIGFDLLQTPFDLQWGCDKDQDSIPDQYERDSSWYVNNLPPGKWDVDNDGLSDWRDPSENPQLGMSAFKRFTLALEPNRDNERYLTLAGYNFNTGQYEPYDTIIPLPDDQRFLMASGPFELMPDSSVVFVLAVMFTCWQNMYQHPDTALILVDKWAQLCYDRNWSLGIQESPGLKPYVSDFSISSSPVIKSARVRCNIAKSCYVSLKMYNTLGQMVKEVYSGYRGAGNFEIPFETQGLPAGVYFLRLKTEYGERTRSIVIVKQ